MTRKELEFAERRMQQKWYDLVMAEQQGASLPVLENMYNSYILAIEVYNRCSEALQREDQPPQPATAPTPVPVRTATARPAGRKRKAS